MPSVVVGCGVVGDGDGEGEGDGEGLEDLWLKEHGDGLSLPLPDPQLLLDHLDLSVKSLWSATPEPLEGLLAGPLVALLKKPVGRLGHTSHCQGKRNNLEKGWF